MSRFIQIRLSLMPVYKPDLKAHFPRLAKAVEELGVDADPLTTSLYHLIWKLEQAFYGGMRLGLRKILEQHRPKLQTLYKAVEEKLAAWKLEGLDELLYQIEDAFQDLEGDLD